ncbi:MAG: ferrochelatase [Acidimicrobiia bacterium]|nr:ferrochelatase [Acidimicrobiia bacterium]
MCCAASWTWCTPLADDTIGVLLMAYGTPATPAGVEAYYTHVRRGRPPTAEQLADLQRRYDAIGGTSPLLERTQAQRRGVRAALDERGDFTVELGMKHASPFIEDAMARLVDGGASRVVGVVLAPHYSRLSIGEYEQRARRAAGDGVGFAMVHSWYDAPRYLDALAERIQKARATLPERTQVVFTAHSLPARIVDEGDPYPEQLRWTAEAVAERAGVKRWRVGWQSAGRTPEPWIEPDILEILDEVAALDEDEGVLVCPAGFTSDHLEILFDLDVEAAARAERLGLAFARTESLNDDPRLCAAVADAVLAHA